MYVCVVGVWLYFLQDFLAPFPYLVGNHDDVYWLQLSEYGELCLVKAHLPHCYGRHIFIFIFCGNEMMILIEDCATAFKHHLPVLVTANHIHCHYHWRHWQVLSRRQFFSSKFNFLVRCSHFVLKSLKSIWMWMMQRKFWKPKGPAFVNSNSTAFLLKRYKEISSKVKLQLASRSNFLAPPGALCGLLHVRLDL